MRYVTARWTLIICLLAFGCGPTGPSAPADGESASGDGTVALRLVDARPDERAAVDVRLGAVELHHTTAGWLEYPGPDEIVPLTDLRFGLELPLIDEPLPAGRINQVVLRVEEAWLIEESGERFELRVPSSRLHFSVDADVAAGFVTRITLDVVPHIVRQGNGRAQMQPAYGPRSVESFADGSDPRDTTYTATVGEDGGELALSDGEMLIVPPNTVDEPTEFEITRIDDERLDAPIAGMPPEADTRLVAASEFGPDGAVFDDPVVWMFPMPDAVVGDTFAVVPWSEEDAQWVADEDAVGAVAIDDGLVMAALPHFSSWAIVEVDLPSGDPVKYPLVATYRGDEGVTYWVHPYLNSYDIDDGTCCISIVAGLRNDGHRQDEWEDALYHVLVDMPQEGVGAIATEVTQDVLRHAETLGLATDAALALREGHGVMDRLLVAEAFATTARSSLALYADGSAVLRHYRLSVEVKVFRELGAFWADVGRRVETAGLVGDSLAVGADIIQVANLLAVEAAVARSRIEDLNALLPATPLWEDPAFRGAWAAATSRVEANLDSRRSRLALAFANPDVHEAMKSLLWDAGNLAIGVGTMRLVARTGSKALGAVALGAEGLVWWYGVTAGDVTESLRASQRMTLLGSLLGYVLSTHSDDEPPTFAHTRLELARLVIADTVDAIYDAPNSFFTKGVLAVVRAGWNAERREAFANHEQVLRDSLDRLDRALLPEAWTIDGATPDAGRVSPTLHGVEAYWWDASPGHYTLNNAVDAAEGEENWATWSWNSSASGSVDVFAEVASEATSRAACYIIEASGVRHHRRVDQRAEAGGRVYLGTFPAGEIDVRLTDITPEEHIAFRLSAADLVFEPSAVYLPATAPGEPCGPAEAGSSAEPSPGEASLVSPVGTTTDLPSVAWDGDGFWASQGLVDTHLGLDFNVEGAADADIGEPVHSPAAGTVLMADFAGSGWNGCVIVHAEQAAGTWVLPDGRFVADVVFSMCHLSPESITVARGDTVRAGQVVGEIGNTPLGSTGPHLHYEVIDYSTEWSLPGPGYSSRALGRVDPVAFHALNRARIALFNTVRDAFNVWAGGGSW